MTADATRTVDDTQLPAIGRWVLDPAHTFIGFEARHLVVTKVRGQFGDFEGYIDVAEDPGQSTAHVVMKAGSIGTGTPDRDQHLRSPDFLDVDNHKEVRFTSTALVLDGPTSGTVTGDLTIRDQTRPVTLTFDYLGTFTDPYGNAKAAFTAEGEIDRDEWGLTWNVPLETGGMLVSKKVKLIVEAQAAYQG